MATDMTAAKHPAKHPTSHPNSHSDMPPDMNAKPTRQQSVTHAAQMTQAVQFVLLSTLGTAAIVSVHHQWRRRHNPEAQWQDYFIGMATKLSSLHETVTKRHFENNQIKGNQIKASQPDNQCQPARSSQAQPPDTKDTDLSAAQAAHAVSWVSAVATSSHDNHRNPSKSANHTQGQPQDGYGVVGIHADGHCIWHTPLPERLHDIVVQPQYQLQSQSNRDLAVMGRRPSECFWILDAHTGAIKHACQAEVNRHFYGHACYSADGRWLYVTENDTRSYAGKIGVYDAQADYRKVNEYSSHGIGPHEIILHPNGDLLVIANGGIKTERASREELNLDSMQPSLVYLRRQDGHLVQQVLPAHNQMSVRHLAAHRDGTIAIGIQFQGEKYLNIPLLLTHRFGDAAMQPLCMPSDAAQKSDCGQWQRFHHYIASVAVDSERNLLCATSPIGGCAVVMDLANRQLLDSLSLADCAGTAAVSTPQSPTAPASSSFIISDGQGGVTTWQLGQPTRSSSHHNHSHTSNLTTSDNQPSVQLAFDNHLQAIA